MRAFYDRQSRSWFYRNLPRTPRIPLCPHGLVRCACQTVNETTQPLPRQYRPEGQR